MSNVKIGLIGAGDWGKNHLRNLRELGVLKRVVDKNSKILKDRKSQYPDIDFSDNEQDIFSDKDIIGVVIASPAGLHYKLAKAAMLMDKDILVEKPLSLSLSDAEELVEIAEKNKRILMVGHILMYHSAVLKLKEIINNGDLGKIRYIYSNRLSYGKIRTEENVMWSFAPHDISLILSFMNEEPIQIIGTGASYITDGIADFAQINMLFPSKAKAHIFVSWLHPFKEQRLVIVGEKKSAVFDDLSSDKIKLYNHYIDNKNNIPTAVKGKETIIPFEKKEPLKEELIHFIESIKTRQRPRTDGREGLNVLKVLSKASNFMV